MKKHEKEIERVLLGHEKEVLKELAKTYERALSDIQKHTKQLHEQINRLVEADVENKTLIQSKIYQLNYQKALQKQISGYLDVLKSEHVKSVEDYMKVMYEDSYLTNIYNLQKYGIPVTVPINQELMIKSLTYDINKIPLSKRLYDNVDDVKKKVVSEISRGISTGMSYQDIARNIKFAIDVSNRKANMIAQNEGQRVKTDARIDSMRAAKKKGADIVKVWDATLDNKTRPVHQELDQKHAEIEEKFKFSGSEVFAPKQFGIAALDINCRCVLLSVPRWDLEDTVQKRDNITGELIEAKNYYDWKAKYNESISGLGAKIGGKDGIEEHDEPILLKNIDFASKKQIMDTILEYEKDVVGNDIETALVISKNGQVYKCFGIESRVYPDYDLSEELLNGAYVSHYHPESETTYSFSEDDLKLFMKYNLDVLRGKDNKYTYELNRNAKDIDEEVDDWMNFDNYEHSRIIDSAKKYGVGYRRWEN